MTIVTKFIKDITLIELIEIAKDSKKLKSEGVLGDSILREKSAELAKLLDMNNTTFFMDIISSQAMEILAFKYIQSLK